MADPKTKEQIEHEQYKKDAKDGGFFDPDAMPGHYRPHLDTGPAPEEKSSSTDHEEAHSE